MNDCFWQLSKFYQDCPFLITYTTGSNWDIWFSFCIINYSFVCQFSIHCYWYCYNQEQSSGGGLQKRCFYKFRKIHALKTFLTKLQIYRVNITLSKKRFQHRYFLVNSTKFFITQTSFKEPFRRLLPHKHSFCLLTHHDLLFFQKRCNIYFPAGYFLDLIYRLGTRVSSIFQSLSQFPIFNPFEHLEWSFFFFLKTVNSLDPLSIFAKKALLQMFDKVLKTPL